MHMATLEEVEIARYAEELKDDMRHLHGKYCRIMGWNIPELDEKRAREFILKAMQDALDKLKDD